MSKFQREIRYMVVKLKHLSESQEHALDTILSEHQIDTHTVECVVVEADWPIYEETWENVRRLAEGRASIRDELARAEAERDALVAHKMAVHKLTGLPASVGVCEPIEGFAERPQDLVPAVRDMALRIKDLETERDAPTTSLARLKAQWQASKLDELMAMIGAGATPDEVQDWLVSESDGLRRQAGGEE